MMKKQLLGLIIFILFPFYACDKNEPYQETSHEALPERQIKEYIVYDLDSLVLYREIYNYDDQGRKTCFKRLYNYGGGSGETDFSYTDREVTYYECTYHADGTFTKERKYRIIYDENNRMTDKISYSSIDTEISHIYYYYDIKGRSTGQKWFERGILLREIRDFIYIGQKSVYDEYKYNVNGIFYSKTRYMILYNKFNKIERKVTYKHDGVTEHFRRDSYYDEFGRDLGWKEYAEGRLDAECKDYVYTENGLTYNVYYCANESILRYKIKLIYN